MSRAPSASFAALLVLGLSMGACRKGDKADPDELDDTGGTDDTGEVEEVEPACEFVVDDWRDTAPTVALQADADGVIDVDPPGELKVSRTGSYDAATGEFATETAFVEGYHRVSRSAEGVLLLEEDGDYEASLTTTTVDVLGNSSSWEREAWREGCVGEVLLTSDATGGGFPEEYAWTTTIVSADEVQEHLETDYGEEVWLEDRVYTSDLAMAYTIDLGEGRMVAEGRHEADGTASRESVELADDRIYTTEYLWALDGGYTMYREAVDDQTKALELIFEASFAYDGSGSGTYTFWSSDGDEVSCTYERDARADPECMVSVSCDNGGASEEPC